MKVNGNLILEIAFNQKTKVKELLNKKGFYVNRIFKDYANNNRCIICTKL
jgi:methylase of polypeptide subunit release factors